MFNRLRKDTFNRKLCKCKRLQLHIAFLGYEINATGNKLHRISCWPYSNGQSLVKCLGYNHSSNLCSFLAFAEDYMAVISPPTKLTRMDTLTIQGLNEQLVFNRTRELDTCALCLVLIVFADTSVLLNLHTNASKYVLCSALLTCVDRSLNLVLYYSRKLGQLKCNYSASDGELLIAIDCLRYLQHYLLGNEFKGCNNYKLLILFKQECTSESPIGLVAG